MIFHNLGSLPFILWHDIGVCVLNVFMNSERKLVFSFRYKFFKAIRKVESFLLLPCKFIEILRRKHAGFRTPDTQFIIFLPTFINIMLPSKFSLYLVFYVLIN